MALFNDPNTAATPTAPAAPDSAGQSAPVSSVSNQLELNSAELQRNAAALAKSGGTKQGPQQETALDAGVSGDTVAQVKQQEQQGVLSNTQAKQQSDSQDQATQTQNLKLKQQSLTLKQQLANDTENILSQFEQKGELLQTARYKSDVETASFNARMLNDKYINTLKTEGAKARLDSKSAFDEALTMATFSDEHDLLKNDTEFKKLSGLQALQFGDNLQDSQREFEKDLGNMNLEMAMQLALSDSDAHNTAIQGGAISDVVKTIGTYYSKTSTGDDTSDTLTPEQISFADNLGATAELD